jgi:hypothetical protein
MRRRWRMQDIRLIALQVEERTVFRQAYVCSRLTTPELSRAGPADQDNLIHLDDLRFPPGNGSSDFVGHKLISNIQILISGGGRAAARPTRP